jgi:hypothetical protein
MENISFIRQIFVFRNQIYQLEQQKHNEIWNQFHDSLVMQIYKDLCSRIPETKSIPAQQLFNKTIHPSQNKEELLSKYSNLNLNFNRMSKIQLAVNDFWLKLASLWTPIDMKYDKDLGELRNQLLQLDTSPELEQLLSKFDCIIQKCKSVQEVEQQMKRESTTPHIRDSLQELFDCTKNILDVHYQLI